MINEFNLEFLISSIETLCKQKNVSVKSALETCGLKRVVVDNMKKGSVPSVDKVHTLANYFGVSVDYLLGRTDDQNGYSSISNVDTNINGNQAHIINNNIDSDLYDIKNLLGQLSKTDKHRAIADILDLLEEKYERQKKSTP